MRKIIITTFFIIIQSYNLLSQWSTDPNNNLIVGYGLDPHICSDSAGGCYITYDYNSTTYPRWLALERLDKYGYKPWGINKRILGETPEQSGAEIIEDGEGGVIVSYIDRYENLPNWTQRVKVQRVDSNGTFLWNQTGVRVTLSETNQGGQYLCAVGDGGCVIAWQDVNYTYYLNRIDQNGNRLWGNNGITLNTGAYNLQPIVVNATDDNYYIKAGALVYRIRVNGEIVRSDSVTFESIITDSDGGIVISGRIGNVYNRKLVAQRQDSLGNKQWQEPYIVIADSLDIGTSLNILANKNYYHYGWLGRKNGITEILQIQSLNNNGTKLFTDGSIALSDLPTSITSVPIIPSTNGSNIYAWTHWDSPQTYNANYVRRIDTTGSDLWFNNPVLLNEPALGYFSMATDCAGGAIGVGYLNADFAIRLLKVSVNGNLGEVITDLENDNGELRTLETSLFQNHPNPFNSHTVINYQIQDEGNVRIYLYNVLGEKILTIVDGDYPKGEHSINFSSENLPSGIYLYKLQTGTKSLTKKLILIK